MFAPICSDVIVSRLFVYMPPISVSLRGCKKSVPLKFLSCIQDVPVNAEYQNLEGHVYPTTPPPSRPSILFPADAPLHPEYSAREVRDIANIYVDVRTAHINRPGEYHLTPVLGTISSRHYSPAPPPPPEQTFFLHRNALCSDAVRQCSLSMTHYISFSSASRTSYKTTFYLCLSWVWDKA